MKSRMFAVALAGALALPFSAGAQGKDELWEVSSQMNMPGMPPGMGASTQRICQDRDPAKHSAQGQNMDKCRVTDRRQSGNTFTVTMACPDGTGVLEQTYNSARTEYKGSMRMGDMVMNMSGRKVGSCDAQHARGEQNAQQAQMKADVDRAQAKFATDAKRGQEEAIQNCAKAADTMDVAKLGMWGQCHAQPEFCKSYATLDPGGKAEKACTASRTQLCAKFQTPDGFVMAQGSEGTAKVCGVSVQAVKTSLCPKAGATAFLGRYCPVEAKPLAQQHCQGRNFTAMRTGGAPKDQYYDFCTAYFANADLQEPRTPKPASAADTVKDGVGQGVNKLRGLFGR